MIDALALSELLLIFKLFVSQAHTHCTIFNNKIFAHVYFSGKLPYSYSSRDSKTESHVEPTDGKNHDPADIAINMNLHIGRRTSRTTLITPKGQSIRTAYDDNLSYSG